MKFVLIRSSLIGILAKPQYLNFVEFTQKMENDYGLIYHAKFSDELEEHVWYFKVTNKDKFMEYQLTHPEYIYRIE